MNNQRAELHIHTNMSALDGINTAKEYIGAAIDNGLSAIAITDHASVQAFPEAYSAWEKTGKKIKLIYGMEAYMPSDDGNMIFHTSILVKNKEGLKNLYRLISSAEQKNSESLQLTMKCNIEKYREGLLIGSGCDKGELYCAMMEDKPFEELCEVAAFYDYLEVVPNTIEALIQINEEIVKIGQTIGKPVVAVSDAHGISGIDNACRKVLLNKHGRYDFDKQLKTTKEMLNEFLCLGKEKAYEIVVENTKFISDMIDDTFPPFDLDSRYEANVERFREAVIEKAVEKYGRDMHTHIRERIDRELFLICSNELSVYNYIIGEKLVKRATEKCWTVGNRGSVASSLVAYLIGITEINPLEAHYHCPRCHYVEFHDEFSCGVDMENKVCKCGTKLEKDGFTIPAETFLGIDGSKTADIDYNFAPEYLKEAFEHLQNELGTTILKGGTIRTLSYEEATDIASDLMYKDLYIDKFVHIKKSNGRNPWRMIIFPKNKEVYNYTPVVHYCNGLEEDLITHFNCMYTSDAYSFYDILNNIDVLTHDDPTIIRKLEELTGTSAKSIPLDDEETMKLFRKSDTYGISNFSTPLVREQIMKKVHPKSFDDLIRIFAIRYGTNTWDDNAEYLIAKGKSISEVISSRDDVMITLLKNGIERKTAYEIFEQIRKGKGLTEEQYAELSNKGIEKWKLDSWNRILYTFPRAHAASYVLYAYRMAYYKVHFPLEFYCAYFNTYLDQFDADLLVNHTDRLPHLIADMKMNFKYDDTSELIMMEVCQEMYDKGYDFTVHNISNAIKEFIIENGKIAPVLRDIF